ncbi:MAG: hypothetical protein RMI94_10755 [Bryobacterales bacterium]|nr:hypothetical protein [Bryobacteraceae bacterium]MDW8131020.1 hypothetical protein [Bryobacterales bacterium]
MNGTRQPEAVSGAVAHEGAAPTQDRYRRARWPGGLETAALLWLAGLGAVNLYRAATQSITADEAFTYNHFAGGDVPVRVYDANNHVLFTWLARAAVATLGLSELSLRLPSVAAGWAYLAWAFVFARRWIARPWLFTLTVAALSLNPFLLDFLSAARGYGLALAFFGWAFYWAVRDLAAAAPSRARWRWIAVCLALAVAANLNFAVPGAALAGAFCVLTALAKPPAARRLAELVRSLLLPGLLLAAAMLAWPLRTARREAFYFGVEELRQTLQGLIFYSFCYRSPERPSALQVFFWTVAPWWTLAVLGIAAVLCGWGLARMGKWSVEGWPPDRCLLMLASMTSWLGLGILLLLKNLFGLKYPVDRTAIYWIPLVTVLGLSVAAAARNRLTRLASSPLAAFLALACVQYALQFDTSYYAQWRYDAGTREMVETIRRREAAAPRPRVRIGASWVFEPSLNFYRQRYRLEWLENVTRDGPRGDYDYYLLVGEDVALVEAMKLEVLRRDPLSGAVLAAPRGMVQSRP